EALAERFLPGGAHIRFQHDGVAGLPAQLPVFEYEEPIGDDTHGTACHGDIIWLALQLPFMYGLDHAPLPAIAVEPRSGDEYVVDAERVVAVNQALGQFL